MTQSGNVCLKIQNLKQHTTFTDDEEVREEVKPLKSGHRKVKNQWTELNQGFCGASLNT